MTKGRYPYEAIRAALKIAVKRGVVQRHEKGPDRLCDFEIVSPPILAPVRIKRMGHVRCTAKALEREAAAEIADLKMYPSSPAISRELWICSKKYYIRFFRVTDAGLVELGPDGQLLPEQSPAPGCYRRRRLRHPVQVTVLPASTDPDPARPAALDRVSIPVSQASIESVTVPLVKTDPSPGPRTVPDPDPAITPALDPLLP